jgi:hypothetical protein
MLLKTVAYLNPQYSSDGKVSLIFWTTQAGKIFLLWLPSLCQIHCTKQIIFINIQNLQHKTLSCKLIIFFLYKLLLDIQKNYLQDKLTVIFLINSYMLTWRTCRLRQLEIKMSLSVIHCMSSDSIWEWTAGTST